MKLNNNFQRYLVLAIFNLIQMFFYFIVMYIFVVIYHMPFIHWFVIFTCLYIGILIEPFDTSKKIYKKFCNKDCENCKMWHCDICKKNDN